VTDAVLVRRIDELPSRVIAGAEMVFARAGLGVTSFGLQVERLPPHFSFEHDESESGQEEVYIVLTGHVNLKVAGAEYRLDPGTLARVAPHAWREITTDASDAVLICIGGVPGEVFEPGEWSDGAAP
jgi:uncharacterized cupin superfamily protein